MRIVLTLASVLLVLFVVMKLSAQQLPRAAADAAPRQSPAEAAAHKVQRALEQGAAARASDAQAQEQ